MGPGHRTIALLMAGAIGTAGARAQQSASYKLEEHVVNSGGHPQAGSVFSSASYRITLDAIGEGVLGAALSSASYGMDGGFASAYRPPWEVQNLRIAADETTFTWNPERSAAEYELYRGVAPGFLPTYGTCRQSAIGGVTTGEAGAPASGQSYFYLVTARNRLREEGTKGYASSGTERANPAPCP